MGMQEHKERASNPNDEKIANSPVLNALRSHIEKWYSETAKQQDSSGQNNNEINNILDEDMLDGEVV